MKAPLFRLILRRPPLPPAPDSEPVALNPSSRGPSPPHPGTQKPLSALSHLPLKLSGWSPVGQAHLRSALAWRSQLPLPLTAP